MNVAGVTPTRVLEPESTAELARCIAELYARDEPFALAGGETELELGNAPRALGTVLRTTRCAEVIDYAPEDQTVTLEAGMTLAAAAAVLSPQRQFLALDGADPDRTTIGGAVATNAFGRRRARYGGIKDTIVGIGIVRPDGTPARGGGKVVKNVAGFDLPKLMVGSLGTLGAIVSATFRVFPIEERHATVRLLDVDPDGLLRVCEALDGEALVPTSVAGYANGPGPFACAVTFDGFARGVEQQVAAMSALGRRLGLAVETAADDAPEDERERAVRTRGAWRLRLGARPTELIRFLRDLVLPDDATCVVYPTLGVALVAAPTLEPATVARWRGRLDGGSVVVTAMPPHVRGFVDAWSEVPAPSLALMRRLKVNFDPKGLCNAGRFVGGL